MDTITSFQNAKVKLVKRLRDKRGREQEGRFVIDDARDLSRALAQGYAVDYALYAPALAQAEDRALLPQIPNAYEVSPELMTKAAYRENPGAWLAVMVSRPPKSLHELHSVTDSRLLALVNLQKPGNIGALLRTADATGFRTVLLVDCALDIYNPNIIRSSTGACFLDSLYTLSTPDALNYFQAEHYQIIAAVVEGDRTLFQTDFRQKCAVVLGTEDLGLSTAWINAAHQRVRIPMQGHISDSLNVSVSGAVFMYEALRQQEFF
ncbi:MAG: RNA methyltransferase [Anaerolineae bacterium]